MQISLSDHNREKTVNARKWQQDKHVCWFSWPTKQPTES